MKTNKSIITVILLICVTTLSYSQDKKLTIIHTNDMHSQVEPISKNIKGFKAGKGGFVRICTCIHEEVEKDPENTLLLDAGDFSQGSVYYNLLHGRTEIAFMNTLHYDAGTLGNHEFDSGIDNLAELIKEANFPFICCNYGLDNTPLKDLVKPYIIVERAGMKIGIFGLGPYELKNVTFEKNIKGVVFKDTFKCANETAHKLRNEEKCDLVICLSHLGWNSNNTDGPNGIAVCDSTLAANSHDIDIIVGGHSHTPMKHGKKIPNLDGKTVYINQTGANTATVGKMVFDIAKIRNAKIRKLR